MKTTMNKRTRLSYLLAVPAVTTLLAGAPSPAHAQPATRGGPILRTPPPRKGADPATPPRTGLPPPGGNPVGAGPGAGAPAGGTAGPKAGTPGAPGAPGAAGDDP